MRLIKLIAPATLIATFVLLAPHANAQTMGEYATTTASVGSGDSSMGTGNDLGGGSRTWGASSLGASFDQRAGAASASGAGADFDSRAGSTGGSASGSRWPTTSPLEGGDGSGRFGDSSSRFQDQDRFAGGTDLSASSDRFPGSSFDDNKSGLDTSGNAISNY
jgi:hypothetical protein